MCIIWLLVEDAQQEGERKALAAAPLSAIDRSMIWSKDLKSAPLPRQDANLGKGLKRLPKGRSEKGPHPEAPPSREEERSKPDAPLRYNKIQIFYFFVFNVYPLGY